MADFDKTYVYPVLDKVSEKLCNTGITPNMITFASAVPTIAIIKLILDDTTDTKQIGLFYFLIMLRFVLDCFDGSLARTCGKTSELGATLDSGMELVWIWGILFAIAYKYRPPFYFYALFLLSILQFRLYSFWEGSTVFYRSLYYLAVILLASQFTKFGVHQR